jgi:hypothetical protein
MIRNGFFLLTLMLTCIDVILGQSNVEVSDLTIKIPGTREEVLYFGFDTGDKITFDFTELNGKELKEIEIIEYPSRVVYSSFKTSNVNNKTIQVNSKGIYMFRFYNGAITGRICKININRIPTNEESQNFNTNVLWVIKQDTTWNTYTKDVIISYDTTYEQKTIKELVLTEQKEELLLDKKQRVHSISNEHGNKASIYFELPHNTNINNQVTRVVSWAYWVGVGEESNAAWSKNIQIINNMIKQTAAIYTTPLGAYAIGEITELLTPKVGEDVSYMVTDQLNRDYLFRGLAYRAFDSGKGIAGYKKFTNPDLMQGIYFINFENDNYLVKIDIDVKVVAIISTEHYEDKVIIEQTVTPVIEKQIFKDPIITNKRIPITSN